MCHAQALRQKQLQLLAQPFAPMAQVRALVWTLVLEELLAGEVLEIGIIDPALAHTFIGQAVNVFEQEKADDEPRLDPGPPLVAVQRHHLAIDELPVDLARELNQFMLHVDDLIQPCPEQIT